MARAVDRSAEQPATLEERAARWAAIMADLLLEAVPLVAMARVEETALQWLTDERVAGTDDLDPRIVAEALALALDVTLFTPSAAGTTAIDRLARQRRTGNTDERLAMAALQRAWFRVLRVLSADPRGGWLVQDIASQDRLRLLDAGLPPACEDLVIATRTAVVEGEAVVATGPMTPLDEPALEVVRARMRADGKGLTNPNRCAAALYRHVVRFGVPRIAGLNNLPPDDGESAFPFSPESHPVHALAFSWAEQGATFAPSPEDEALAREHANEVGLIAALCGWTCARLAPDHAALATAYERIATIHVLTVERRAATGIGIGLASLDALIPLLRGIVEDGLVPPGVIEALDELRRRTRPRAARPGGPRSADLDRVLGRIQALRAKTVDRGCTEDEAIAAAAKVADLLDRYGLSLSEVELKQQVCEGFGIGTGRRRFGPIDGCIPAVAAFCDCRVWSEKAADGEIRYVFFGLPADVAGARYLYELVEQAFVTETLTFKTGDLWHTSPDRRRSTTSFQTGLAHGIAKKLDALHRQREAAMTAATGRDLVPVKAAILDEELAKLGLRFNKRAGGRGGYLLRDAYDAGHEAGQAFEHRPGLEEQE